MEPERLSRGVDRPDRRATNRSAIAHSGDWLAWQGLGLQFLAAQYEGRPTGIDMSLVATLIARRTGLTVKRGTSHALPFASASFDVIVVVEALFVFAGWAQALKEIRRVLVPGGHLVTAEFTSLTTNDARDAVARRAHDAQLRLVALVDHTADARRAVLEGEPVRARYLRHVLGRPSQRASAMFSH